MSHSSDDFNELGSLANSAQSCLQMLRAVESKPGMNERARKEIFISYLRLIFPESEHTSRITALAGGAETFINTLPSSLSSSTRGFVDTLNGKLVIEFKANLLDRSSRDTAEIELKRYIASLWTSEGSEASFCCIATDILRWIVWRPVPNVSPSDHRYTADMVVLEEVEALSPDIPLSGSTAHHLVLLLKRTLIDENLLSLNAENLRRDFGLESALYGFLSPLFKNIILRSRTSPEARLAIELWESYQAYNALSTHVFDIDFYTKQLYLVMLSRLMVAASFRDGKETIVDDNIIRDILTGSFFVSNVRLANFVDHDFFGWTFSDSWIGFFLPPARQIYHTLRSYDFSTSRGENVFQLIYEEMMRTEQQGYLGQKSTPETLVVAIIQALLQHSEPGYRYLDPACGSGSFLRAALQETAIRLTSMGLSLQQQLEQLINAVTGIDVDPIAVILAKATWALTVAPLLPYAAEPVYIPIYHADALFVVNDQIYTPQRKKKTLYDNPNIVFDKDSVRIEVPLELFNDITAFDLFVNWCYRKAEGLSDASSRSSNPTEAIQLAKIGINLSAVLGTGYSSDLESKSDMLLHSAEQLIKEFAQRILAKRNGIWAFILRNSYRPSLFAGRFDLIASNPPWLTMSSLTDIPYKDQLQKLAEYFHIRPTGSSFLHTEIATTFALHNVFHFLVEKGWAAFIMPRTLFDGNHHQAFRQFLFKDRVPFAIKEIWDLGQVEGLFKIPSCVVFGVKNPEAMQSPSTPIPTRFWTSLETSSNSISNGNTTLANLGQKNAWVTRIFITQTVCIVKERPSDTDVDILVSPLTSYGYYGDKFRQGADLMPRIALFVDLINNNPAQRVVSVHTSAREVANPQNKVLKGRKFRGSVNRRYLFTTITSSQLLPFIILGEQAPTVVLPIEFNKDRPRLLSSEELIELGDIESDRWFKMIDRELGSKKIRDRIDERKKLTQQKYIEEGQFLVHYGTGGTHPCAGIQIVGPDTLPFVADQTTNISIIDNEDEAYYLVGMLNAPIIGDLIQPFQAKGERGARHIHKAPLNLVPPYNREIPAHQQVVALSKITAMFAYTILTDEIRDESHRLEHRRSLLRTAVSEKINDLNKAVREVLQG